MQKNALGFLTQRWAIFFSCYVSINLWCAPLFGSATAVAPPDKIDSLKRELSQTLPDTTRVRLLVKLSRTYAQINPDSGVATGRKAQRLAKRDDQIIAALFAIGGNYFNQDAYDSALLIFDELLALARQTSDSLMVATALRSTGAIYHRQSRLSLAAEYLVQAIDWQTALRDSAGLVFTLNTLGIVYHDEGSQSQALDYYTQALRLAEKHSPPLIVGMVINNIAIIYQERGEYQQALAYYQRSVAIDRKTNSLSSLSTSLENVGIVYWKQGDTLRAQQSFREGLEHARSSENRFVEVMILCHLGSIQLDHNHYDSAQHYFEQSFRISESIPVARAKISTRYGLARLYFQQSQYATAKPYVDEGFALAQNANQLADEHKLADLAHKIYARLGRHKEAYQLHTKASTYQDSLFNTEKERELNESVLILERSEKERLARENALQKSQLDLRASQLSRQRAITWATFAIAIMLLILVGLFFMGQHQLRKSNRALIEQDQKIREQQAKIMSQTQALQASSEAIKKMNQRLQYTVQQRTQELTLKNRQLEEYAFMNAHKLRGPIARLLGLTELISRESNPEESLELMQFVKTEARSLDEIVRSIAEIIGSRAATDQAAAAPETPNQNSPSTQAP